MKMYTILTKPLDKKDIFMPPSGAMAGIYARSDNARGVHKAPANETAQLTDWVSLGKFKSGAEVPLTVILNVPIEMGNDFQSEIGELQWQFKVNKTPVNDRLAQTGDDFNLKLIGGIAAAALILALIMLVTRRKDKE